MIFDTERVVKIDFILLEIKGFSHGLTVFPIEGKRRMKYKSRMINRLSKKVFQGGERQQRFSKRVGKPG